MTAQGGVFTSADSEVERLRYEVDRLSADCAALQKLLEERTTRLAKVVEAAKSSPLVSYTPVDGEAIHVVPVSVVLAAAQPSEEPRG